MKTFREYISEAKSGSLTIFDIDETLFHTTAKIAVLKDGKLVRHLDNQQFNTYQLKAGETYDFSEFRSAEKFNKESKPINNMMAKAIAILKNSQKNPLSKMIILTARANFDNKETFLDTFRKYGLDIDKVRVERAGNINDLHGIDTKKFVIVYNYLKTNQFGKARLFDDSKSNLVAFLKLKKFFPNIEFEAYFVDGKGTVKELR